MNIIDYYHNRELLEKQILFYLEKNQIKKIGQNYELIEAYIKKARHNLEFYNLNKSHNKFNDWLITILYYTMYHCALSLITKKNYSSKNHTATIVVLIKEYRISKEDIQLIHDLSITKEDAELYTSLKKERHDASYKTNTVFQANKITYYEDKIKEFINKTEKILKNE